MIIIIIIIIIIRITNGVQRQMVGWLGTTVIENKSLNAVWFFSVLGQNPK
jgi:hypothetical protein